jgi:hypothetical protein
MLAEELILVAKETKQAIFSMWAEGVADTSAVPTTIYMSRGDAQVTISYNHDFDKMVKSLPFLCLTLLPDFVCFLRDGLVVEDIHTDYLRPVEADAYDSTPNIFQRFADGDQTVSEALSFEVARFSDNQITTTTCPYRVGGGGVIEWGQQRQATIDVGQTGSVSSEMLQLSMQEAKSSLFSYTIEGDQPWAHYGAIDDKLSYIVKTMTSLGCTVSTARGDESA